jgi:hypothetical protein
LWTPAVVSAALTANWDAQSGITVTGAGVSAWASTVGTISAAQATDASRPPYSATGWNGTLPCLTFDGLSTGGDFLQPTANIPFGAYWVFLVLERDTQDDTNTSAERGILVTALSSGGTLAQLCVERPTADASQTNFKSIQLGTGNVTAATTGLTVAKKSVAFAQLTDNDIRVRVNGGTASSAGDYGATTGTTFYIGRASNAARCYKGKVAQILMANPSLLPGGGTDAERQKFEGYLAHRWGCQANLDAAHPYLTTAPVV